MAEASAHDTRPLLLLVDDDEDSRFLYTHYLTTSGGFRVAEAADGREAIDAARSLMPDVIVMDLSLPVVDGRAALRTMRDDDRTREIPVIALTGHATARGEVDPKRGFTAVLVKPCLPEDLAKECELAIRRTR